MTIAAQLPASVVGTIAAAQAAVDADPLAHFRWPSEKHKAAARHLSNGIEVHVRGANYSGKTRSSCAWVVAFMQQREELDGVPIPQLGRRVVGAVLVPTREQAKDSSQAALRAVLGEWPHHESMFDAGNDLVSTLWVKPAHWLSDDHTTWSRLTFIPQGSLKPKAIKGQRWDFVLGDEPPEEDFWREARKNAKYRCIAETPLRMPEWEWIQRDFDGPLGEVYRGRVEIVTTLYDNGHLTPDILRAKEDEYRGDKFWRARIYGEYVNVDGACPLPYEPLERMLAWADVGFPWEQDERIEVWYAPRRSMPCFVIADPSAGVKPMNGEPGGDACGLWVCGRRRVNGRYPLMARLYGWVKPHELARLAVRLSHAYADDAGPAMIVWEVNGVGEAGLPEFADHPNIFREYDAQRVDMALSGRIGWYEDSQSKAACLGALIRALSDDTLDIPSAAATRSLMALRTNQRDELIRRKGQNHEDLSCAGKWAWLLSHPLYAAPPMVSVAPKSSEEEFRELVGLAPARVRRVWEPPTVDRWR